MLQTTLIFLVQQCRKCQNVEKQKGGSHGDGHGELRGVVLWRDSISMFPTTLAGSCLRGLRGSSLRTRVSGAARRPAFGQTFSVRIRSVVLRRRTVCEGGHRLEELIHVMQVWNQLEPEGDFCGAVVISDPGFEADVKIQLLLWCVLGPGHFFEAVWFCVDELGVLGNRLVWITTK